MKAYFWFVGIFILAVAVGLLSYNGHNMGTAWGGGLLVVAIGFLVAGFERFLFSVK